MKAAVFDCHSGIAGDMTIGAFLDAGFDFGLLKREISKLGLHGVRLAARKTRRGILAGTKFEVMIRRSAHGTHTSLADIQNRIQKSRIHPGIKALALKIFRTLAQAEAKVHGTTLSRVMLHEAGAIDAIVDVVGTAAIFHHLALRRIFVRDLSAGGGEVHAGSHGKVGAPSPVTLELLKGFPVTFVANPHEMVTPTGAAILAALAERMTGPVALEVESVGYGAGSAEFHDRANLLRVTVGTLAGPYRKDRVILLETNLDDMSPLGFELLYKRLFEAGALDVFVTPILMKKMRPAHKLSVLFAPPLKDKIAEALFRETPTLGVRFFELDRLLLDRKFIRVRTKFGSLRVKIGALDGQTCAASPEYEDVKKLALRKRVPFRQVYEAAKQAAAPFLS
jgi:uncharacterized protein (TIGR00299 family) protein